MFLGRQDAHMHVRNGDRRFSRRSTTCSKTRKDYNALAKEGTVPRQSFGNRGVCSYYCGQDVGVIA